MDEYLVVLIRRGFTRMILITMLLMLFKTINKCRMKHYFENIPRTVLVTKIHLPNPFQETEPCNTCKF